MSFFNDKLFIVGEISGNHAGDIQNALELVNQFKDTGINAIKLQTYTPQTITHKNISHFIDKNHKLWGGSSLFDLYSKSYTPWEWHEKIFKEVKNSGLIGFSTPFDETAVDFLEGLDVPLYKIASLEIIDFPLIKKICKTGKPIILSTGASNLNEIEEAVSFIRQNGDNELAVLLCTSSYPTEIADLNLNRLKVIKKKFKTSFGLSDHSNSIIVGALAVAMGATVIEKHIKLESEDTSDSEFSFSLSNFKTYIDYIFEAQRALGSENKWVLESELVSRSLRPSIFVVSDVKKGDILNENNVDTLRPALGLPPRNFFDLLGRKFNQDLKSGTPLQINHLDV